MFRTVLRALHCGVLLIHANAMRITQLEFSPPSRSAAATARKHVLCGTRDALLADGIQDLLPLGLPFQRWQYLIEVAGADTWMFTASDGKPSTVVAAVLPDACSRHASWVRPHAVTSLIKRSCGSARGAHVIVILEHVALAGGTACAIGRAFPTVSLKSGCKSAKSDYGEDEPIVRVSFATQSGPILEGYSTFAAAAEGVRRAARLVDLPPNRLTTTAFVGEAQAAVRRLAAKGKWVDCCVTSGEELRDQGYGYLWGVGKAAEEPPALVVLTYLTTTAPESAPAVCLVGKGIVYDTGGLSLKSKEGMAGMKSDMGGAAACLAAFEAAVEIGVDTRSLHLVLCLAENAIGPGALRNDDVIEGASGLTCEINNSDAEGRLVLSDGVAHATAIPPRLPGLSGQPDLLIDMATLTGAQLVATGKRHAAIVSNLESVESQAVAAGRLSGDTVHPLPFVPEFYAQEFTSQVADFKNSVSDRNNAQSSCAANFIFENIHPEFEGGWLHVDLAGPAFIGDRGTGFGVGLALALLKVDGFKLPG